MANADQLKAFLSNYFSATGGTISFKRFMEAALYDPKFGYYTTNIANVGGPRADFSTWATLGDLGRPLARWILAEKPRGRTPLQIIEVGGGDGSLAASVLKHFGWMKSRKVDYHIVEISGPLRTQQQKKLKGKPVQWHASMGSALKACEGMATIFSNELVDAFPVNWLRWNGAEWEEVYVRFSDGQGLSEEFRTSQIRPGWQSAPFGQRVEIHQSYFNWLNGWLPDFKSGLILTIDYGGNSWESIYSKRLHGTLRGYFRQHRVEGAAIYQRFGRQDLTCDVNFQEITRHGNTHNLETISLENLLSFMNRYGENNPSAPESVEPFQVLIQRRTDLF